MTSSVQEQREALGKRLREIRRRAGVSGRELARIKGWHESKISKLEYGVTRPSDADIRAYCRHCNADGQLEDLLATLHNIDSAYVEWRQQLRTGMARRQRESLENSSHAKFIRNWEPAMVSGLLQTADYASAVMSNVIAFYQIPNDLDEAVATRMERQQILYQRGKRFHILLGEQSLYTTFGDDHVMAGQLDRLYSIIGLPRVTLGIVPRQAEGIVVVENFFMFDDRLVKVEGHSAGISITQPREIALYGRAFDILAGQSVTGDAARELIRKALESRSG
ncbi:helix-turn-helix domain-containing protein [Nocardia terpenica]|uniref:DNA-binding protein n=1 Tax=Nocardia terpenica TaxID=455432 RepID=A0A291RCB2_9NOCA|nr:helix-turn-helix transcriptional regulator [Nocardia terpenica]ATL64939.1 DNA-binding protein [Nocardia terpenica]